MKKRIISLFLCFLMIMSLLPGVTIAEEGEDVSEEPLTAEPAEEQAELVEQEESAESFDKQATEDTEEHALTEDVPSSEEPEAEDASTEGQDPEADTPVETQEPEEEPVETETPSEEPEVPAETPVPVVEEPAVEETPVATEIPPETPEPPAEQKPAESEVPAETAEPAQTEAPVETEVPTETEAPAETEAPVETEVPAETAEPDQTEAPVAEEPAEPEITLSLSSLSNVRLVNGAAEFVVTATCNRADVTIRYQWQKLNTKGSYTQIEDAAERAAAREEAWENLGNGTNKLTFQGIEDFSAYEDLLFRCRVTAGDVVVYTREVKLLPEEKAEEPEAAEPEPTEVPEAKEPAEETPAEDPAVEPEATQEPEPMEPETVAEEPSAEPETAAEEPSEEPTTEAEPAPETEAEPEENPEDPEDPTAQEETEDEGYRVEVEPRQIGVPKEDPDKLFQGFVKQQLGRHATRNELKSAGAGNGLTGVGAAIYQIVSPEIHKIAIGERASTEFIISAEDLGLGQTIRWTAEELGVEQINTEEGFAEAFWERLYTLIDYDNLYSALRADNPYDLYWIDLNYGIGYGPRDVLLGQNQDWVEIRAIWIGLCVSEPYRNGNEYAMNTTIGSTVVAAGNKARAIVYQYASLSDYEKLCGYCREICDLVDYNWDVYYASESGSISTSFDPWQIIWVFDEDPETKVVCEGYAKAFQHLCDLTNFKTGVQCISVVGDAGGAHMWNVVRMEDGLNYLVDVTWSDGTANSAGFLLQGYDEITEQNPSAYPTYYVEGIARTYDAASISLYGEAKLTLSDHDYVPGVIVTKPIGWQEEDGYWKYYDNDGCLVSGWQNIEGKWYFFDFNGIMQTGWERIRDEWYYFNGSGVMQTGWQKINNKWYYFETRGAMVIDWQTIGGKKYYFNGSGVMQTGWQKINNKWYYFNSSGAMQTGWLKISAEWYYLTPDDNGSMAIGWKQIGAERYYFNKSGVMQTGQQFIDGEWYTFTESGALLDNREQMCGDTLSWHFDSSSGKLTVFGTGEMWDMIKEGDLYDYHPCPWQDIKNTITEIVIEEGVVSIGAYAFAGSGSLRKVSFPNSLKTIGYCAFFNCCSLDDAPLPDGIEALCQQAFSYCAFTNVFIPSSVSFLDNAYSSNSKLESVFIDGDSSLGSFIYVSGVFHSCPSLQRIEVSEQHFALRSEDGVLYSKEVDGGTLIQYPFGRTDTTYRVKDGTNTMYRFSMFGDTALKTLILPDSIEYIDILFSEQTEIVFEGSCPLFDNEALSSSHSITVYYPNFDPSWTSDSRQNYGGNHVTWIAYGWKKEGSNWKWIDPWGNEKRDWLKTNGNYYYFNSLGVMQTGWQKISDKWYYFNAGGDMVTGWKQISSKWYYFNTSGVMQTGWQKISDKWYYFNKSGVMLTGAQSVDGRTYCFKPGGEMATGWIQVGSKWYYCNTSGVAQTSWQKISDKWYYFNAGGDMVTGWKQISGKWYYFNSSGIMQTGWQKISDKWYYFNSSGMMLTGTQTIGGKTYMFDSSGMCTNP